MMISYPDVEVFSVCVLAISRSTKRGPDEKAHPRTSLSHLSIIQCPSSPNAIEPVLDFENCFEDAFGAVLDSSTYYRSGSRAWCRRSGLSNHVGGVIGPYRSFRPIGL